MQLKAEGNQKVRNKYFGERTKYTVQHTHPNSHGYNNVFMMQLSIRLLTYTSLMSKKITSLTFSSEKLDQCQYTLMEPASRTHRTRGTVADQRRIRVIIECIVHNYFVVCSATFSSSRAVCELIHPGKYNYLTYLLRSGFDGYQ